MLQAFLNGVYREYGSCDEPCASPCDTDCLRDCILCHRERYRPGGRIRYDCENIKRVYIMRYTAAHVAQALVPFRNKAVRELMKEKNPLSMVSIGGGPGIEGLALLWILFLRQTHSEVIICNIDSEASWEPHFRRLVNGFAEAVNIRTKTTFLQRDATQVKVFNLAGGRYFDIVYVPWILSELNDSQRSAVLVNARKLVSLRGIIIVSDRSEPLLSSGIRNLINGQSQLSLVGEESVSERWCGLFFPDDLKPIFQPKLGMSSRFWLLKDSKAV